MIALSELIGEVKRSLPQPIAAIIVGEQDYERLQAQVPCVRHERRIDLPYGALGTVHGVPIFEDPGLPPGNYQVVKDASALRERLWLIRLGLTVTPEGWLAPASWWLDEKKS